jgi:ethanolamine ammonia-lyase small subunit
MSIEKSNSSLQRNELKKFTTARVGLSTSGVSLSTEEVLAFRLAHARAVDAVWVEWNATSIQEKLKSRGVESIIIESTATSRLQYVQNPHSGCELNGQSIEIVKAFKNEIAISIILADGLSPKAVEEQGCELITALLDELRSIGNQINPIFICRNGRVAIGDHLGEITKSKIAIVIIGERPGLTTHQSLGMYITLNPTASSTNANRNCISNIHHEGLSIEQASNECKQLIEKMLKHNISGYQLNSK